MIKAILFDCYDVLYVAAGPEYFSKLTAVYPQYADELRDLGMQADYGFISLDDLAHAISKLTGQKTALVGQGLRGGHVHNTRLLQYIPQLRRQFKTALVSNMSYESLHDIFSPDQQQALFNEVIISSEIGLLKPSPDIFLLAAQRLGVDTSECLFIDDVPANCDGARAVGMQAETYNGVDHLLQVFRSYGAVVQE